MIAQFRQECSMPHDQPRASPDALLALTGKAGRGRLKIFLGASPGVGKTYAMLQAAQAIKAENTNIAVGLIETHGRRETENLLSGLTILPRAPTSLIDFAAKLGDAQKRDLLFQIKAEAQQLDAMVRNLLAMTRLEAGALEIKRDWVDMIETCERAIAVLKRRGATQLFSVAGKDVPLVMADAILMDQVVGNVLENAVKYAGPNAQIDITLGSTSDRLCIAIKDDGPGIAPDLLPHVFEKFTQRSGDSADGTGLGLAIAKGIIETHGGTIQAQSPVAKGHGCRIVIELPLV
jgi:K+-sensing histidine kinase KdpD